MKNYKLFIFLLILFSLSSFIYAQSVENVTLTSTSNYNFITDNLTCDYDLYDGATTSAISWYVDLNPIMELYLPMEGNSTNALLDYSGNNYVGSFSGTLWNSTGGYDGNGGLSISGTDYMDTNFPASNLGTNWTMSAWIKWGGIISTQTVIFGNGASGDNFALAREGGTGLLHFRAVGISNEDFLNTAISDTNWHHVAFMANSSHTYVYVDGTFRSNMYQTKNMADVSDIIIGASVTISDNWDGSIDEVRIYNRTLSPEQIYAIYSNRSDLIVSQETTLGDTWQCSVTPFSVTQAGTTYFSNNLTIIDSLISIDFITPTPINNTKTYNNNISIRINATENIGTAILEWNGTNYTMTVENDEAYYNLTSVSDGLYTYKVYANNTIISYFAESETRTIFIDSIAPFLYFEYPNIDDLYFFSNFNITANVSDENLYQANVTMYNSTNDVVWNTFYSDISGNYTYYFNFNTNLSYYDTYTVELCANDDHTNGVKPKKDKVSENRLKFNKLTQLESDVVLYFYDDKNKVINAPNDLLTTFKEGDEWDIEFTSPNKFNYMEFHVFSNMTLTDRSDNELEGHLVWGGINGFYYDFNITRSFTVDGLQRTATLNVDKVEDNYYIIRWIPDISINKDEYVYIDPLTGGLNVECKNRTFSYVNLAPTSSILNPNNVDVLWYDNQDINITFTDINDNVDYCNLTLNNYSTTGTLVDNFDNGSLFSMDIRSTNKSYSYNSSASSSLFPTPVNYLDSTIDLPIIQTSGNYTYSFKYFFDGDVGVTRLFLCEYNCSSSSDWINSYRTNTNGFIEISEDTNYEINDTNYWHNLIIIVNLDANTTDWYVDGNLAGSNIDFYLPLIAKTNVGKIGLYDSSSDIIYIDDIYVCEGYDLNCGSSKNIYSTINDNFTSYNLKVNYTDYNFGDYYMNLVCFDSESLYGTDEVFITLNCNEDWRENDYICSANFTKQLSYYDNNMCGTNFDLPIDNSSIVSCECDNNDLGQLYYITPYCDINDTCYVIADTVWSDEQEDNVTFILTLNNVDYIMPYINGQWQSGVTSNISEDVNVSIFGFTNITNTSCFSQKNGVMKFRESFDVNISFYRVGLLNDSYEPKLYVNDFNYVYLVLEDVYDYNSIMGGLDSFSNKMNNGLRNVNQLLPFKENVFHFSKTTPLIDSYVDTRTYHWAKYEDGVATITLYERNKNYSINIVNTDVMVDINLLNEFSRPFYDDAVSLDNEIVDSFFINESITPIQVTANLVELNKYALIPKIIYTAITIAIILLIILVLAMIDPSGRVVGASMVLIFPIFTLILKSIWGWYWGLF